MPLLQAVLVLMHGSGIAIIITLPESGGRIIVARGIWLRVASSDRCSVTDTQDLLSLGSLLIGWREDPKFPPNDETKQPK